MSFCQRHCDSHSIFMQRDSTGFCCDCWQSFALDCILSASTCKCRPQLLPECDTQPVIGRRGFLPGAATEMWHWLGREVLHASEHCHLPSSLHQARLPVLRTQSQREGKALRDSPCRASQTSPLSGAGQLRFCLHPTAAEQITHDVPFRKAPAHEIPRLTCTAALFL